MLLTAVVSAGLGLIGWLLTFMVAESLLERLTTSSVPVDAAWALSLWCCFPMAAFVVARQAWAAVPHIACTVGYLAFIAGLAFLEGSAENAFWGYANLLVVTFPVYFLARRGELASCGSANQCSCGYHLLITQRRCPECGSNVTG